MVSLMDLQGVLLCVLTAACVALERLHLRVPAHVHAQRVHALALEFTHLARERLLSHVAVLVVLVEARIIGIITVTTLIQKSQFVISKSRCFFHLLRVLHQLNQY